MMESLLFFLSSIAVFLVVVWAVRNDRRERDDLLSRLLAARKSPEISQGQPVDLARSLRSSKGRVR
jgi:hypothetical protein